MTHSQSEYADWCKGEHSVENAGMTFHRVERSEQEASGFEYINALCGYALMLTRNSAEAEDLVQETYVRALEAQHQRLPEDSNIKGCFFTILRDLWLNQLRKRKSEPTLIDVDGEDGGTDLVPGHIRNSEEILIGQDA